MSNKKKAQVETNECIKNIWKYSIILPYTGCPRKKDTQLSGAFYDQNFKIVL